VLKRLSNCIPGGFGGERGGTRPGEHVRSCGHWLFHLDADVLNEDDYFERAGPDGVPIVFEDRRRMWAGGKIDFLSPLLVDSNVEKTVRVTKVESKNSERYGEMIFVTRESTLRTTANKEEVESPNIVDITNHVYLKDDALYSPPTNPIVLDPQDFEWKHSVRADPVSLFRFSALTWNSHRIHYDLNYTTQMEGYPDLVVHGPILSMLMLDLFQENTLSSNKPHPSYRYEYRGVQPLFLRSDINLVGRRDDASSYSMYALNSSNEVCMKSTVMLL
jgi:3-methylfumaryl-CoA hydratase